MTHPILIHVRPLKGGADFRLDLPELRRVEAEKQWAKTNPSGYLYLGRDGVREPDTNLDVAAKITKDVGQMIASLITGLPWWYIERMGGVDFQVESGGLKDLVIELR